jgi:hypothetical protein
MGEVEMAPKAKGSGKKPREVVEIIELKHETLLVRIVGDTPMIYNAMSNKAKRELLIPRTEKQKGEDRKAGVLKHVPMEEYRASVYRFREERETRLLFPGGGAKAALMNAATDIPSAAKAAIGRLCHIVETDVPIWGVPQMLMSVVRNKDKGRTPDVRTRAILAEWCAEFRVRFTRPNLRATDMGNLLAAAGVNIGWGDYRPEKGKGSFGMFHLVDDGDEGFERIKLVGGREAQDAALANPTFYDAETEELYGWFLEEVARREIKLAS